MLLTCWPGLPVADAPTTAAVVAPHGAALVARYDRTAQMAHTTRKAMNIGANSTCFSPVANSDENTVNPTTPATVTATAIHILWLSACLWMRAASSTDQGTGGMVTKLRAAEICLSCGCEMVIANGSEPTLLYDIVEGKPVGTRFVGESV